MTTTTPETQIPSANYLSLLGTTTQKEPFSSHNGHPFTSFRLRFRSSSGSRFIDVVSFGDLAIQAQGIAPHTRLRIQGSLDYTEKDGRQYFRVIADQISTLTETPI